MPLPNLLFNVNNLGHLGELKVFNLTVVVMATPLEATRRIDKIIKEWDRTLEVLNRIICMGLLLLKLNS